MLSSRRQLEDISSPPWFLFFRLFFVTKSLTYGYVIDPRKSEALEETSQVGNPQIRNIRSRAHPTIFLVRSPEASPLVTAEKRTTPRFERHSRSTRVFRADAFHRPVAR